MKAIVLVSGGLDSAVVLAHALSLGRECFALSFDYGQRHKVELKAAQLICAYYAVPQRVISIEPAVFGNWGLVSQTELPKKRTAQEISAGGIPSSYVPARNALFLSYAMGQAELLNAEEIYYGPNQLDSNYPDCRVSFLEAFQQLLNVATKQASEGHPPKLITPLIHWNKEQIVQRGRQLNVPIDLTFSCYDPLSSGQPCQQCDACILRRNAIEATL